MNFTAAQLPNGNLQISFNSNEDRTEAKEMHDNGVYDLHIMWEGLEHYWANGSYEPFDASQSNPSVKLDFPPDTALPCIADSMDVDDDGQKSFQEKFWLYSNYMTKSFIAEMLETGSCTFTLAPQQN